MLDNTKLILAPESAVRVLFFNDVEFTLCTTIIKQLIKGN